MNNHNQNEQDYIESWDAGTYQTGSFHAPKGSSGLKTFLLMVFIFIGGMVSMLGILNIRNLDALMQTPDATVNLSKNPQDQTTATTSPFQNVVDPLPSIPDDQPVDMPVVDLPMVSDDPDNDIHLTAQEVYQQNAQSMVQIHCVSHFNNTLSGMGLVLTENGYLLTNAHLVDNAIQIYVTMPDGSVIRAALVGSDPFTDLAVLYVTAEGLKPATFSSTRGMQLMDKTFAVEQLATDDQKPSPRESKVYSTGYTLSTSNHSLTLIQTYSGGETGPVFNDRGQVLGFQVGKIGKYFEGKVNRSLGMVIPSAFIRNVVLQLTEKGYVSNRPGLGMEVETISKLYQQYWDLPGGMMINSIQPGSSAENAQLKEGDILLALDGKPMNDRDKLYAFLYQKKVGDEVIAVIMRNQHKYTITLTLEEAIA